ncbi:MAG: UDP-N-acetylmuramoyl-tripeptide--D-alanyl-D-alanine ligase [Fibrobacterota bacterium]
MIPVSLKEFSSHSGPFKLKGISGDLIFRNISTDSRSVKNGDLFFAIPGEKYDGHDFITSRLSKKCSGIVVSSEWKNRGGITGPFIITKDVNSALLGIAGLIREKGNFRTVAITGSNGKTTAKEMTAFLLSTDERCLKTPGNYNNRIGVPLTFASAGGNEKFAVIEMGANHVGEIGELSKIVKPDTSVITSIGESHIEYFGSVRNIIKAKLEITAGLRKGGALVYNADSEGLASSVKGPYRKVSFGIENKSAFHARNISIGRDGCPRFSLDGIKITLKAVGAHSIYNALASIAAAVESGMDRRDAAEKIETFRMKVGGRLETIGLKGAVIINDSYNANPTSMRSALNTLSVMNAGRRIAILGDMFELGDFSERFHHSVGVYAAGIRPDMLFCVGKAAAGIAKGAKDGGMPSGSVFTYLKKKSLAKKLASLLEKKDKVLIKGSRGMELEKIIEYMKGSV